MSDISEIFGYRVAYFESVAFIIDGLLFSMTMVCLIKSLNSDRTEIEQFSWTIIWLGFTIIYAYLYITGFIYNLSAVKLVDVDFSIVSDLFQRGSGQDNGM